MKLLFLFLLKTYSKTEEDRLEIYEALHQKVCETYNEQTAYGNVYNANIEFVMANSFIQKIVRQNNQNSINMLRNGIKESFDKGVKHIQTDILNEH